MVARAHTVLKVGLLRDATGCSPVKIMPWMTSAQVESVRLTAHGSRACNRSHQPARINPTFDNTFFGAI